MPRLLNMNGIRCRIGWCITLVLVVAAMTAAPSLSSAAAGNDWRLLVKNAACTQGPDVLLGEIADPISSMDQRTWKSIAAVKLWRSSTKPGRPVTVTRKKLEEVLKYYMGDMVKNLVLPSQLTVQTGGRVLTGEQLKARAVAFLTPRAADLGDNVEFKNFQLPMHMFFPNAYDKLKVSLGSDLKPGRNVLKLRGVTSDGKVVSRKVGTVFLNVWKAVPVAAKPMNRFERVTQDKVSFQRVNLAYKPNVWDGTGGPWRMARTLGRGQPFTKSHLEQIPLIEKGELVQLVYKGKRIQLTIKAEALAEAAMGQQVAVRNLQSRKTVLATVIGDDTVMVR
jgi:flagella basal body P-ring formation protein FlgA